MPVDRRRTRGGPVRIAAGLVLGIALLIAAIEIRSQERRARGVLPVLHHADLLVLTCAALLELLSYLAPGLILRVLVFGQLPFTTTVRIAAAALGAGALLPAQPLPGGGIAFRELHRRGVSARQAGIAAVGLMVVVPAASMAVLAGPGLLVSALWSPLPGGWPRVVEAAAAASLLVGTAVVALLAAPAAVLDLLPFGAAARHHDWMGERRRAGAVLGLGMSAWLADAACLVLVAAALHISVPWAAFPVAYVTAATIIALPVLPGGLGAVEVTVPLALSAGGGSYGDAVLVVLAWRVLSFWVPTLAGLVSLASLNRPGLSPSPVPPAV